MPAPTDTSAAFLDGTTSEPLGRVAHDAIATLLRHSTDLLALIGPDGALRFVSPAVEGLLGRAPDDLVGRPIIDLVHPDDHDEVTGHLARILGTGVSVGPIRCRVVRPDGEVRVVEVLGSHVGDVAGLDGTVLLNSRDVTELSASEEQRAFERDHDPATGLPREQGFEQTLAAILRSDLPEVTVLALGIDDLRALAGGRGADAQDEIVRTLLGRVAGRLDDPNLRPPVSVARLDASTFLVLCADDGPTLDPLFMGEEARLALSEAAVVDGRTVRPSVSVGVVAVRRAGCWVSGDGGPRPTVLVDRALVGLREARSGGGGLTVVVDDELALANERTSAMAADLRRAIDGGDLDVRHQPKVSLETGRIVGFEALARWTHPGWGAVPPPVFIDLAERHDLIVDLGRWILQRSLADAASWPATGTDVGIAVNISARQFSPDLVGDVAEALRRSGVAPARLTLEVTESTVMGDPAVAATVLRDLSALGVRLSIDDFGTGYSSLAHLRSFPLDELKIDRSFVEGLGRDPADSAIVAAVMAMAHALGLTVVAEGIEDEVQRTELRRLGAEVGQGFLFARPLSATDAAAALGADGIGGPAPLAGGADVVVADDAPEVLQLLTVSLAAAGYTPHPCADGATALDTIRTVRPVAAVLDVSMPGLQGPEVTRLVRHEPALDGCTIVALSAHAAAEDRIAAFRAGADDYVVKPFSPRDIVSRVTAAIERRRELDPAAAP